MALSKSAQFSSNAFHALRRLLRRSSWLGYLLGNVAGEAAGKATMRVCSGPRTQ